jgi:hypothetical protein
MSRGVRMLFCSAVDLQSSAPLAIGRGAFLAVSYDGTAVRRDAFHGLIDELAILSRALR